MKKIITLTTLLAFATITIAKAQTTMTLQEAMRYAVENSTSVSIQELTNKNTHQDKIYAVASLFPSLSASSSLYNSYGRSIDPETNTYTTIGNVSNSYSLSTYLTVFSGLTKINAVKASRIGEQSGEYSLQQIKDATALSVMQLYFDVIYYGQSVDLMREQKEASEKVLTLTRRQAELGIKSKADVALSAAQVASYDLLLTQQQNLYTQTQLDLKEAMNFPFDDQLSLAEESTMIIHASNSEFLIEANPEYQVAKSQLLESEVNLKIARGAHYPTLGLGAGYNNYYYTSMADGYVATSFTKQLQTNYGYYVYASLSIPIFNKLYTRTSVTRSRNNLRSAQLQLYKTELSINKSAREAILQRDNSFKEHISAEAKVEANELAYTAMLRRFEQGISSIIDLQTSANDLLQAKAEELRSRLNYQIKCRMVDYYSGKQIIEEE